MTNMIRALDTISGKISEVTEDQFNHPAFHSHLVEVSEDQKELVPELHKPTTRDQWIEAHEKQKEADAIAAKEAAAKAAAQSPRPADGDNK